MAYYIKQYQTTAAPNSFIKMVTRQDLVHRLEVRNLLRCIHNLILIKLLKSNETGVPVILKE